MKKWGINKDTGDFFEKQEIECPILIHLLPYPFRNDQQI